MSTSALPTFQIGTVLSAPDKLSAKLALLLAVIVMHPRRGIVRH